MHPLLSAAGREEVDKGGNGGNHSLKKTEKGDMGRRESNMQDIRTCTFLCLNPQSKVTNYSYTQVLWETKCHDGRKEPYTLNVYIVAPGGPRFNGALLASTGGAQPQTVY